MAKSCDYLLDDEIMFQRRKERVDLIMCFELMCWRCGSWSL